MFTLRGLLVFIFSLRCARMYFSYNNVSFFSLCWMQKVPSETLILEFNGRSDRKNARLRHKFLSMGSVTVCTRLRFDRNCFGISTVFSYSIQSYINEFQLRANLVQGKPVQLALLVHAINGSYQEVFEHDGSWHSICVSWSQNGGGWVLFIDGLEVFRGNGLNSSNSIGPNGLFLIGQAQHTFGGSFKKDESFSGSITDLFIWDRVLNNSEIYSMEKDCSPISSGLVFKWAEEFMEIESSLTTVQRDSPCKGIVCRLQHGDGKKGYQNRIKTDLITVHGCTGVVYILKTDSI